MWAFCRSDICKYDVYCEDCLLSVDQNSHNGKKKTSKTILLHLLNMLIYSKIFWNSYIYADELSWYLSVLALDNVILSIYVSVPEANTTVLISVTIILNILTIPYHKQLGWRLQIIDPRWALLIIAKTTLLVIQMLKSDGQQFS